MELFGHGFHHFVESQRIRIIGISFEKGVVQVQGLVFLAGRGQFASQDQCQTNSLQRGGIEF